MGRRLLVVTFFYPPDTSVGSHRWPPLERYLRERGHEVTVLTTSAFGTLPSDDPWVVRTRDLQASPLLRRALRRPPELASESTPNVVVTPAPRLLTDGLVPDAHVASWLPFVVGPLRRLVREREIECVITNGPPDSTHLAGLALGRGRPAWIADFEDGWRFEPQRLGWPTAAQDRADAALEARVARSADALVGLSEPIARDFRERFGADAVSILNAWDPALEAEVGSGSPPELEPGTVSVVHTGNLSHGSRRDPSALLEALERIAAEVPESRLRLVLAGRLTSEDRARLDALSPAASRLVRHLGELDRPTAIALQRRADAQLLLITGGQRSIVSGKIFEYLASRRPILALTDDNEAARIVRETRTGLVVPPLDPHAVAAALRATAAGELMASFDPTGVDAYVHPGPAIAYEHVIDRVVARRAALDSPRP